MICWPIVEWVVTEVDFSWSPLKGWSGWMVNYAWRKSLSRVWGFSPGDLVVFISYININANAISCREALWAQNRPSHYFLNLHRLLLFERELKDLTDRHSQQAMAALYFLRLRVARFRQPTWPYMEQRHSLLRLRLSSQEIPPFQRHVLHSDRPPFLRPLNPHFWSIGGLINPLPHLTSIGFPPHLSQACQV